MAFLTEFAANAVALNDLSVAGLRDAPVAAEWRLLAAAVDRALTQGETHYTDRPGILPLRERVAAMLAGRFGIVADARSAAVITCGAVEARFVALQQLVAPGESVWAPAAVRDAVAGAALIRRAVVVDSPAAARLVYLTSSLGEAVLRKALADVPAGALVLFEVDEDANGFHPAEIGEFAERTVTIGQIGYASWQMGFLVAPGRLAAGLRDFKQALTICSTNLSQWAALAAMEAA